jgi:hypothetical protein
MFSRNTFHDIRGNGVSGPAELAAQLVPFIGGKRFFCELVHCDK